MAITKISTTMGRTQVILQDWKGQVMPELLELTAVAPVCYGVTQGPEGTPREEEGREPTPGPSSQETVAMATPSDSPLPDTGASQGQQDEEGVMETSQTPGSRPGPSRSRAPRGRPPRALQATGRGRQLAPSLSDVHSGESLRHSGRPRKVRKL